MATNKEGTVDTTTAVVAPAEPALDLPTEPTGSGAILVRTQWPYEVYNTNVEGVENPITPAGTKMTRAQADAVVAESNGRVFEVQKEDS